MTIIPSINDLHSYILHFAICTAYVAEAGPRPQRSRLPSCNLYAGKYLSFLETESIELENEDRDSDTSIDPLGVVGAWAVQGSGSTFEVEESVSDAGDDDSSSSDDMLVSGIDRAGFGKVLYVEPRDV